MTEIDDNNACAVAESPLLLDETFNESVCLDLESFIIDMLSGDGALPVRSA